MRRPPASTALCLALCAAAVGLVLARPPPPQQINCPGDRIYGFVNQTTGNRSAYENLAVQAKDLQDCIRMCFGNQFCYSITFDHSQSDNCLLFYYAAYNCTHNNLVEVKSIAYKNEPITVDCLRCPSMGEFITAPPAQSFFDQQLAFQTDKEPEKTEKGADVVPVQVSNVERIATTEAQPAAASTAGPVAETTAQPAGIPTTAGSAAATTLEQVAITAVAGAATTEAAAATTAQAAAATTAEQAATTAAAVIVTTEAVVGTTAQAAAATTPEQVATTGAPAVVAEAAVATTAQPAAVTTPEQVPTTGAAAAAAATTEAAIATTASAAAVTTPEAVATTAAAVATTEAAVTTGQAAAATTPAQVAKTGAPAVLAEAAIATTSQTVILTTVESTTTPTEAAAAVTSVPGAATTIPVAEVTTSGQLPTTGAAAVTTEAAVASTTPPIAITIAKHASTITSINVTPEAAGAVTTVAQATTPSGDSSQTTAEAKSQAIAHAEVNAAPASGGTTPSAIVTTALNPAAASEALASSAPIATTAAAAVQETTAVITTRASEPAQTTFSAAAVVTTVMPALTTVAPSESAQTTVTVLETTQKHVEAVATTTGVEATTTAVHVIAEAKVDNNTGNIEAGAKVLIVPNKQDSAQSGQTTVGDAATTLATTVQAVAQTTLQSEITATTPSVAVITTAQAEVPISTAQTAAAAASGTPGAASLTTVPSIVTTVESVPVPTAVSTSAPPEAKAEANVDAHPTTLAVEIVATTINQFTSAAFASTQGGVSATAMPALSATTPLAEIVPTTPSSVKLTSPAVASASTGSSAVTTEAAAPVGNTGAVSTGQPEAKGTTEATNVVVTTAQSAEVASSKAVEATTPELAGSTVAPSAEAKVIIIPSGSDKHSTGEAALTTVVVLGTTAQPAEAASSAFPLTTPVIATTVAPSALTTEQAAAAAAPQTTLGAGAVAPEALATTVQSVVLTTGPPAFATTMLHAITTAAIESAQSTLSRERTTEISHTEAPAVPAPSADHNATPGPELTTVASTGSAESGSQTTPMRPSIDEKNDKVMVPAKSFDKKDCVVTFLVDHSADHSTVAVDTTENATSANQCALLCYHGSCKRAIFDPAAQLCKMQTKGTEKCPETKREMHYKADNATLLECFRCQEEEPASKIAIAHTGAEQSDAAASTIAPADMPQSQGHTGWRLATEGLQHLTTESTTVISTGRTTVEPKLATTVGATGETVIAVVKVESTSAASVLATTPLEAVGTTLSAIEHLTTMGGVETTIPAAAQTTPAQAAPTTVQGEAIATSEAVKVIATAEVNDKGANASAEAGAVGTTPSHEHSSPAQSAAATTGSAEATGPPHTTGLAEATAQPVATTAASAAASTGAVEAAPTTIAVTGAHQTESATEAAKFGSTVLQSETTASAVSVQPSIDEAPHRANSNALPFEHGCIISFQADPFAARPSHFTGLFDASTVTKSVSVCASRCYQDGCNGAKFDHDSGVCYLGYDDQHFCNNSPLHQHYKANETIWIHCLSCRPHKPGEGGFDLVVIPISDLPSTENPINKTILASTVLPHPLSDTTGASNLDATTLSRPAEIIATTVSQISTPGPAEEVTSLVQHGVTAANVEVSTTLANIVAQTTTSHDPALQPLHSEARTTLASQETVNAATTGLAENVAITPSAQVTPAATTSIEALTASADAIAKVEIGHGLHGEASANNVLTTTLSPTENLATNTKAATEKTEATVAPGSAVTSESQLEAAVKEKLAEASTLSSAQPVVTAPANIAATTVVPETKADVAVHVGGAQTTVATNEITTVAASSVLPKTDVEPTSISSVVLVVTKMTLQDHTPTTSDVHGAVVTTHAAETKKFESFSSTAASAVTAAFEQSPAPTTIFSAEANNNLALTTPSAEEHLSSTRIAQDTTTLPSVVVTKIAAESAGATTVNDKSPIASSRFPEQTSKMPEANVPEKTELPSATTPSAALQKEMSEAPSTVKATTNVVGSITENHFTGLTTESPAVKAEAKVVGGVAEASDKSAPVTTTVLPMTVSVIEGHTIASVASVDTHKTDVTVEYRAPISTTPINEVIITSVRTTEIASGTQGLTMIPVRASTERAPNEGIVSTVATVAEPVTALHEHAGTTSGAGATSHLDVTTNMPTQLVSSTIAKSAIAEVDIGTTTTLPSHLASTVPQENSAAIGNAATTIVPVVLATTATLISEAPQSKVVVIANAATNGPPNQPISTTSATVVVTTLGVARTESEAELSTTAVAVGAANIDATESSGKPEHAVASTTPVSAEGAVSTSRSSSVAAIANAGEGVVSTTAQPSALTPGEVATTSATAAETLPFTVAPPAAPVAEGVRTTSASPTAIDISTTEINVASNTSFGGVSSTTIPAGGLVSTTGPQGSVVVAKVDSNIGSTTQNSPTTLMATPPVPVESQASTQAPVEIVKEESLASTTLAPSATNVPSEVTTNAVVPVGEKTSVTTAGDTGKTEENVTSTTAHPSPAGGGAIIADGNDLGSSTLTRENIAATTIVPLSTVLVEHAVTQVPLQGAQTVAATTPLSNVENAEHSSPLTVVVNTVSTQSLPVTASTPAVIVMSPVPEVIAIAEGMTTKVLEAVTTPHADVVDSGAVTAATTPLIRPALTTESAILTTTAPTALEPTSEPPVAAVSVLVDTLRKTGHLDELTGKTTENPVRAVSDLVESLSRSRGDLDKLFATTENAPIQKPSVEPTTILALSSRDEPNTDKQHVDITHLDAGSEEKQTAEENRSKQGKPAICNGRVEFQVMPVQSQLRLNITNDIAASTPADCARKCHEERNCKLAGYIPTAGSSSGGVCLLTSDTQRCTPTRSRHHFVPQYASTTPFIISCIQCSKCSYGISTITPDRTLPDFETRAQVLSVGQCAEECAKIKCTLARFESSALTCSMTTVAQGAASKCTNEVSVQTDGVLPVLLDCVTCAA